MALLGGGKPVPGVAVTGAPRLALKGGPPSEGAPC